MAEVERTGRGGYSRVEIDQASLAAIVREIESAEGFDPQMGKTKFFQKIADRYKELHAEVQGQRITHTVMRLRIEEWKIPIAVVRMTGKVSPPKIAN